MPHNILEYSANLPRLENFSELFDGLHQTLNKVGGIKLGNCKSRARMAEDFYVGDGGSANAFIHLDVEFVQGRSTEVKRQIGQEALDLLKQYYADHLNDDLQITVNIRDISIEFYFKYPEGSLNYQKP
ncbi:MAG: 5-carboxymethyl-2-hydroxymuconate isomerase [Gammaproteobacteria bacterium]|jgi:5-carboxymethyl-2-hydroxymuconate isomerase